jgi:uncharacterized damage-inducible protein DinB
MSTLDYFRTLARYNQWANRELYAAVGELSEADYMKPRAAFFGSIHGTLNHNLVGDRLWMGRITGHDSGIRALDQILYGDFPGLRVAREAEDAQIINVIDAMDEPTLNTTLRYRPIIGDSTMTTPMRFVLAHLFNHGTHHRGQAHGLLSQTSVAPPPLDLIFYLREAAPQPA